MIEVGRQKMGSVEKWRKFFQGAGADICSVIEYAIVVAASDCPKEFRTRRDRIAQRLYACRFVRCRKCDLLTLAEPEDDVDDMKGVLNGCPDKDNEKLTSSTDEADGNRVSNYSYEEAEALTEEIEEESQFLREVYRIKDILSNPDESENQLHEALRRLELMQLSVETLKATEIGKQVNKLRKHPSKEIQSMVKMLIRDWKDLVDEWVKAAGNVAAVAIAGTSPDSISPAALNDESGLPSPPLDEGAFLVTQTTSIEISQFFDGMDDDGIPHSVEVLENGYDKKQHMTQRYHKTKQLVFENNVARDVSHRGKQQTVVGIMEAGELQSGMQTQVNDASCSNRTNSSSGPGRPVNGTVECKGDRDSTQHCLGCIRSQMSPGSIPPQHKPKSPDDASVRVKVEASKRRLQEGYQQAENAKKQRTIQVMDLQDLPKQGPNHVKPFFLKSGSQCRQWVNNRR